MPLLHLGRAIKNAILTFSAGFLPVLFYGYFEGPMHKKALSACVSVGSRAEHEPKHPGEVLGVGRAVSHGED